MASVSWDRLTIEEMDGDRRVFAFANSTAPHGHVRTKAAFVLGGKVNRSVRREFGSNVPVVTVTGVEQMPLTIHVHFRDSLLGVDGAAQGLFQKLDSIQRSARMLSIVWGDYQRVGMLQELSGGMEGRSDIDLDLTFDIHSQGELVRHRRVSKTPLSLTQSVFDIDKFVGAARKPFGAIPGMRPDISGLISGVFSLVANPLGALLALGDDIGSAKADVRDSLRHALVACDNFINRMADVSRMINSLRAIDVIVGLTGADLIESTVNFRQSQNDAALALQAAIALAMDIGTAAAARIQGSASGRVLLVRDGDTFESLAYRAGVSVQALRDANPTVPMLPVAGTILAVPA